MVYPVFCFLYSVFQYFRILRSVSCIMYSAVCILTKYVKPCLPLRCTVLSYHFFLVTTCECLSCNAEIYTNSGSDFLCIIRPNRSHYHESWDPSFGLPVLKSRYTIHYSADYCNITIDFVASTVEEHG